VNSDRRWLSELSDDAPEQALLRAGRDDGPSGSAIDQGYKALSATIGVAITTTYVGSAAAKVAAATSTAAQSTVSGAFATTSTSLAVLAVKPVIIGFVIGTGVLGSAYVVEKRIETPKAEVSRIAPRPTRSAGHLATYVPRDTKQPLFVAKDRPPEGDALAERAAMAPQSNSGTKVSASEPKTDGDLSELSLTEQAREIAKIKRLLLTHRAAEALGLLRRNMPLLSGSALAEDYEALYIEALEQSGDLLSARARAARFIARFPNSPHGGRIEKILSGE